MKAREEFPAKPYRTRYPWDKILDGTIWELIEGEDFHVSRDSMQANVYMAAKARGGKAKTQHTEKGLLVQFKPKEEKMG